MATNLNPRKIAYGFSEPLLQVGLEPIIAKRDPTTADKAPLGTEWVNTAAQDIFFLASLDDNTAIWIPITNPGATLDFDTDSGTATPVGDTIQIVGGAGVNTSGAGNTVTINLDSPSGASTFHTGSGDATVAAGAITIAGGNNISTTGAGSTVTINVAGTTNHAVQVGNAGASLTSLAVGLTNTVLLGATGADPVFGAVPNAALSNSSITLTNGQNITVTGSPVSLGGAATIAVSGVIPIANGGTNASAMATTDGVVYFDGTRLVTTSAGTSGQVLTSNGAGVAPTYQAGSAGTLTSITGDTGGAQTGPAITLTMGASNTNGTATFVGAANVITLTPTDALNNTAWGEEAMGSGVITGAGNVCLGFHAGNDITSGATNTLIGSDAGALITTSANNVCIGYISCDALETGDGTNTAVGVHTGSNLVSGAYNTFLGAIAGGGYTSNESSNICIGYNTQGTNGEDNTLRIGNNTGTGLGEINQSFVAGIDGITVTGTAVLVSSSDQLGIAVSSRRFKNDIEDMKDSSGLIYKLRPVTFVWNQKSAPGLAHATQERQYGLIAEEVAEVIPQLVGFDKKGNPRNVHYGDLTSLLLNEIQKLKARIEVLESKLP